MEQFARAPIRMVTLSELLAAAEDESAARELGITLNRIYFLFLDQIKKSMKPHIWRAKRPVVHAAAVATLRHETGREDVCIQVNDEQYLLIFAEDAIEVVANRCKRIAASIERRLYGQKSPGKVLIRNATQVFADGSIHNRKINEDLADAKLDDEPVNAEQRVEARFGSVFSPEAREARLTNLLQVLEDDQDEPLSYEYTPLWHAKEGRIATFLCRPRRGNGADAEYGYAALGDSPDPTAISQFDTHGYEECLFALKSVCDSGARTAIMAPVHFDTLASRATRSSLHGFLAAIPRRFRKLITLQLSEVPDGVPDARLTEITANLGSTVRALSASIRMADCPTLQVLGQRAGQFARARVGVITLDFEGHVTDETLERATRMATKLAPSGLRFAAVNVPSVSALCELSIGNFTYLGGPAIGEEILRPERPRPFTMQDLERADLATHPKVVLPADDDNMVYL